MLPQRACAVHSATGTRTRVARVRAEYPNQLDYSGFWQIANPEKRNCQKYGKQNAFRDIAVAKKKLDFKLSA